MASIRRTRATVTDSGTGAADATTTTTTEHVKVTTGECGRMSVGLLRELVHTLEAEGCPNNARVDHRRNGSGYLTELTVEWKVPIDDEETS